MPAPYPSNSLWRKAAAGRCAGAAIAFLALLSAAASAPAQSVPQEMLRPGPRPPRATHGEALAFARTFAVAPATAADRALLLYTENGPNGSAPLRSAVITPDGRDEAAAIVRSTNDPVLCPDVRAVALAWDGTRGLAAVIVPPPRRPSPAPGTPSPRRAAVVGLPPVFPDGLGPEQSSGGDIAVLPLDARGAPAGPLRVVFHEHTRAARIAVVAEPTGYLLAWTGSTVTDDELRGTVRLLRLDAQAAPTHAAALAANLAGDLGDGLALHHHAGHSTLSVVAARCEAAAHEPSPEDPVADASAHIEPPGRPLMPQQPLREQPGPPIVCGPMSLHRAPVGDHVGPWSAPIPLRGAVVAHTPDGLVVAPEGPHPHGLLARVAPGLGPLSPLGADTLPPPANPVWRPVDLSLRHRPAPDAPPPATHEAPRPPPDLGAPADVLAAPAALAALDDTVLGVAPGRRAVAAFTPSGALWLHRTEAPVMELAALRLGDTRWLLQREGLWSGPVRALRLAPSPAATQPSVLARLTAVRVAPAATTPSRFSTRAPYTFDERFALHWVHARTLRGQFMAYEYTAGILAARPEAPTDPRMPAIVAARNRLRARWESACGPLQTRGNTLARQGAGAEVLDAVRQLCDLHPDLQLGVPINPAL